jgi:uncharacterized protein YraI
MGDRTGWIIVDEVAISDPSDWRTQVWFDGPGVLDLKESPSMGARTLFMVPTNERLVVVNDAPDNWLLLAHELGTGWSPGYSVEIIRNGPRTAPGGAAASPQLSGNVVQPSAAALVAAPMAAAARNYVIVNTSYLNIRSGPGAQYTSEAIVSGGTELYVTASTPDGVWYLVEGDFGSGWVNSEFVIFRGVFGDVTILGYDDVVGQPSTAEVIVSAPVNVYNGAGVNFGLMGTASAGLTLEVIGRSADGTWLQVQTTSGPGWVLASTVTLRGSFGQVPVIG